MTLNERLQEAFDKRVCGTAMLPASDLLSAITAIEQAETENAALKEQVARLATQLEKNNPALDEAANELDRLEETIAAQAEAIRLKDDALSLALIGLDESWEELNEDRVDGIRKILAIKPSPDILKERDERVAEACAKYLCKMHMYDTAEAMLGEWRKYL